MRNLILVVMVAMGMFAMSANASVTITSNGIQMNVTDAVVITVQPVGYNLYETEDLVLSVTAVGQAPINYQWRKDGIDIAGATDSVLTIPGAVAGDSAITPGYDCVVDNLLLTPVTSAPAAVNVYTWPDVVETSIPADIGGILNIATGMNAEFTVTITAAGANPMLPGLVGIQWNKDGGPAPMNANMSLNTVTYADDVLTFTGVINPDDTGFYECVVVCTAP